MNTHARRDELLRAEPWLALVLGLAAAVAGATEPASGEPAGGSEPTIGREQAFRRAPVITESSVTSEPAVRTESAVSTEPVASSAPMASRAARSSQGTALARAAPLRPRIGRIFFSPAERRDHHRDLLGTASSGSGRAPHERRIVNGALSSGTGGRAVWVNGATVENTARDKSAWADRDGNVWLKNGAQGAHLMRPGQSIDRNGVIEDLLPAGAVARR